MNNLSDIFLHFLEQSRMYHWQTKSYAQHKTFGEFYDEFNDLVDEFIECYMGKYGRVSTKGSIDIKNTKELPIEDWINSLDSFLVSLTQMFDNKEDTDLLNIRDEMLGKVSRLRYLLTLE